MLGDFSPPVLAKEQYWPNLAIEGEPPQDS
jgi:hypothetical protein